MIDEPKLNNPTPIKSVNSTDVNNTAILNNTPIPIVNKEQQDKLKKKEEEGPGRPTVMTERVLGKLEQAFGYDMTDEEACLYAGIHPSSLYDYQKNHPEFTERKQALKNTPVLLARETVVKALRDRQITTLDKKGNKVEITIPADPEISMKYLERKKKDEFSPHATIDHSGGISITSTQELADTVQKILTEDDKPKNPQDSKDNR